MRTVTTAETQLFSSLAKKHCLKVEVANGGYWYNLSNLEGYDFVISANWGVQLDEPLMTANIELFGHIFSYCLSPDVSLSRLNRYSSSPMLVLGAKIQIRTATVPLDVVPDDSDWKNVFEGYITTIELKDNGNRVNLFCRDKAAPLQDWFIREELVYGSNTGAKDAEDVMQDIIDDSNFLSVTVYTPSSPGFKIGKYVQQKEPLLEALRTIALQNGYDLRYKWRASSSEWELTYYEPSRTKSALDFTFYRNMYVVIPSISYDLASIRNLIRVPFTSAGDTGTATGSGPANKTLADTGKSWTTNEFLGDKLILTSGTGVGEERTITYHDGTVITVDTDWTTKPIAGTTYEIVKRRKTLDYPYWGTATAGAASTLTDTNSLWTADEWAGYKVRIVSGTGISQVRTISSNTFTALTVSSNWTVNPASGSKYIIFNASDYGESLEWYGQRFMEVTEDASNQIKTKADARALARAIYNDLSFPYNELNIEVDYFWPVELGDLYSFEPNYEMFDQELQLAVVGFKHSLTSSGNKTELQLRGRPSGYKHGWLKMAAEPGVAPVSKFPATPSGLGLYTGQEVISYYAYIQAYWTTNYEKDLSHYLVRFKRADIYWCYLQAPAGYTTLKIPFLKTSTDYKVEICAVNKEGKKSPWSSSVTITTSA